MLIIFLHYQRSFPQLAFPEKPRQQATFTPHPAKGTPECTEVSKVGGKLVWRSGTVPVEARGGGKGLGEMLFQSVEKQGIQVVYGVQALDLL